MAALACERGPPARIARCVTPIGFLRARASSPYNGASCEHGPPARIAGCTTTMGFQGGQASGPYNGASWVRGPPARIAGCTTTIGCLGERASGPHQRLWSKPIAYCLSTLSIIGLELALAPQSSFFSPLSPLLSKVKTLKSPKIQPL